MQKLLNFRKFWFNFLALQISNIPFDGIGDKKSIRQFFWVRMMIPNITLLRVWRKVVFFTSSITLRNDWMRLKVGENNARERIVDIITIINKGKSMWHQISKHIFTNFQIVLLDFILCAMVAFSRGHFAWSSFPQGFLDKIFCVYSLLSFFSFCFLIFFDLHPNLILSESFEPLLFLRWRFMILLLFWFNCKILPQIINQGF